MTVAPAPLRSDLGWRWQMLGGRLTLVTGGDGRQIVLGAAHGSYFITRDSEIGLRELSPTDEVAKIISAAPDLLRAARDLIHGVRIGLVQIAPTEHGDRSSLTEVLQRLIEAMERSEA